MNSSAAQRPNALVEIGVTIIVPAVVLMQLSRDSRLGPTYALLLALAFPLAWGLRSWFKAGKFGFMPALGVISTLLTGGIGVLRLDASWLAVKEAAVPTLFGLAVLASSFTKKPLIHALLFQPALFDVDKINRALEARGTSAAFAQRLRNATYLLAGTFAFSAVMNYALARWLVTSPAGTEAFNQELGRMTLLSYPIIALPSMAMMMGLLWWIARGIKALAGLSFDEILHGVHADGAAPPAADEGGSDRTRRG